MRVFSFAEGLTVVQSAALVGVAAGLATIILGVACQIACTRLVKELKHKRKKTRGRRRQLKEDALMHQMSIRNATNTSPVRLPDSSSSSSSSDDDDSSSQIRGCFPKSAFVRYKASKKTAAKVRLYCCIASFCYSDSMERILFSDTVGAGRERVVQSGTWSGTPTPAVEGRRLLLLLFLLRGRPQRRRSQRTAIFTPPLPPKTQYTPCPERRRRRFVAANNESRKYRSKSSNAAARR